MSFGRCKLWSRTTKLSTHLNMFCRDEEQLSGTTYKPSISSSSYATCDSYVYPVFSSDEMKIQYAAGLADYYKQLVPAYLQRERLAKKIAVVVQMENGGRFDDLTIQQVEKSGRFVLSDQGTYIRIYDHMICEMCEM